MSEEIELNRRGTMANLSSSEPDEVILTALLKYQHIYIVNPVAGILATHDVTLSF
jgi:hypothetical protein